MGLRWKVDVLTLLKEKGWNTNRIRKENKLAESTLQKLRRGEGLNWDNIDKLCHLLDCQPGDLIEFIPDSNLQEQAASKPQK